MSECDKILEHPDFEWYNDLVYVSLRSALLRIEVYGEEVNE